MIKPILWAELPLLTNCSAGLGQDLGRTNQKLGRTSRTFGNSAGHFEKKTTKKFKMPENALKYPKIPKTPIDRHLKTLQMSFRTPYNPLKYLK